jgi:hypothetical protein
MKFRNFFIIILSFNLFVSLFLLSVIYISVYLKLNSREHDLLFYQLNKLENNSYETIFLGDSTLGNAIDSKLWEDLTGKSSANLALTGSVSFEGSLALLEKSKMDKLKNVYIFTGTDIWMRPVSQGYDDVNKFDKKKENLYFLITKNLNQNDFKRILRELFNVHKNHEFYPKIVNDYIKQNNKTDIKKLKFNFDEKKINEQKIFYLKKINKFCVENKIKCIHLHGPIINSFCEKFEYRNYISRVNKILKDNDIIFSPDVICINSNEVGDGEDHVGPEYKKKYTIKYLDLIKNIN